MLCQCGTEFFTNANRIAAARGKFCSKQCMYKYRIRPSGLQYNIVSANKGWFRPTGITKKSPGDKKYCPGCKEIKIVEEFYKSSRINHDGYRSYCIRCNNDKSNAWSANNKLSNRRKVERHRAKKIGQIGIVPKDYWEILISIFGTRCLSCGDQEKLELDHVIPLSWGTSETKLHDISNFQILCRGCNARKKDKMIDFRIFQYGYVGDE